MKKLLLIGIPIAAIIAINIIYGSVISWMLSIAIIACLLFFTAKLGLENIITSRLRKFKEGDMRIEQMIAFDQKWKAVLNVSLLTIVFLSTCAGVYFTLNPTGERPWYTNNEYHGLSNTGIAFNTQLTVTPITEDSSQRDASIAISKRDDHTAELTFYNFYQPVVVVDEEAKKSKLINNILDAGISNSFSIRNKLNQIDVDIEEQSNNILQRLMGSPKAEVSYRIKLNSNDTELLSEFNVQAPFSDELLITGRPLAKGMSLFNLFLDNETFQSNRNESYQVLEAILTELGSSYLLVNRNETEKDYALFPDKPFQDNGYQLFVAGRQVPFKAVNKSLVALHQKFYIGFNNAKRLLHLSEVDLTAYNKRSKANMALIFDYPNTYMLRSPGAQSRGDKNIRFITNNFDDIIDNNLQEGFHFTTYNLKVKESVAGTIDYITGGPNTPLALGVTDNKNGDKHTEINDNRFALSNAENTVHYLFDLRDFSQNGFSVSKSIGYLAVTYIAFVMLSLFFGGKRIDRIEPVILSVIMVLLAIRYIMFWRVATFPPLDNITKHELENTLINFDFNLGINLPIPLTLIWTLVFVLGIIIYRQWTNKIDDLRLHRYFGIDVSNPQGINKHYALFTLVNLILFFLNKHLLHIEALTRIISILIPLAGYWYYAKLCNRFFTYRPLAIKPGESKILIQLKAYFYYLFNNPTFVITTITLAFFALCDRGFAILFALFILLKNIFINFLKKPLDREQNSIKRMLYKPHNYWIYAFTALIVYLTTLSVKSLFYYMLTYKLWVITAALLLGLLIVSILYSEKKKLLKGMQAGVGLWILIMLIPAGRNAVDHQINNVIKHVQYRASIIVQPISELMQDNEYTSFKTRKIIETAENQWFINSYISKDYDNRFTINTRPHSRVGVDYSTQTRDVVVARYIISEMGNLVMYEILVLLLLPLILYLIAYRVHLVPTDKGKPRDLDSYAGLIPLIMLFTIALFVWLTATNRFVFFGQDFPFLSLTSRISVLVPLILFGFTLIQRPTMHHAFQINLRNNAIKYLFFFGIIAAFALSTVKQNELNNKNFSVVMDTTKEHIDINLNNILQQIQDSLESKRVRPSYAQLISVLSEHHAFRHLKDEVVKDKYTRSILENLIAQPSSALQLSNPLFMIYDNGRYSSVYNKNLYLELPPVESRKIWNGSIGEILYHTDVQTALVSFNNKTQTVQLPYFMHDVSRNLQFALLPGSWFGDTQQSVGLLNLNNSIKHSTSVYVYKNAQKNIEQSATSFVSTIEHDDLATIYHKDRTYSLSFRTAGNRFAMNKWVNGKYKIIYPLRTNNFWIYNFANAIKSAYSNSQDLQKDVLITLDYQLAKDVQDRINNAERFRERKNKKYNFSAIAADGDGNVRFMADFVTNRQILDPNNEAALYNLQKQQFFYSNAKNERDQWGNRNLLNLFLGPGSSVKPLTAAAVASQVNAGWEALIMQPFTAPELEAYAGYKLLKPWKNDEHYFDYLTLPKYIEVSSNFYQSLIMFLGSYRKEDFFDGKSYSLAHLLQSNRGKENNDFPVVFFMGQQYYLPNLEKKKGNWPATDRSKTTLSFFGNENSLLANGFEQNLNLRTKDKDKQDGLPTSTDRVSFVDSTLYQSLDRNKSAGFLWGFPEQSFFLQSERASEEIHQNFNLGLKTATLGGYPYRVTPFMMLQMYMSMVKQDKNFRLGITPKYDSLSWWTVDSSWNEVGLFDVFMAKNIFQGMSDVIFGANGTARRLSVLKSKYPNFYFYAKTGTINEQTAKAKSSRRLILIVTDKDLSIPSNVGKAKTYAWYFATDSTGDFDWNLLQEIVDLSMNSNSFRHYFNK